MDRKILLLGVLMAAMVAEGKIFKKYNIVFTGDLNSNKNTIEKNCCKEKEDHSTDRIIFTLNEKTAIQIAVNESAGTVSLLDYKSNVSALYNGNTGAVFGFDYNQDVGVYMPPGTYHKPWLSSKQSFEEYFGNLPPQLEMFQYGESHGIRFEPSSDVEKIYDEMTKILAPLSPGYSSRCEVLAIFLQISRIPANYLRSSINGFSKVVGKVNSPMRGDFKWFIGLFLGVGHFFEQIHGGIEILEEKGVRLGFDKVLNEPSGIHVLIYLLDLMTPHFDVGRLLGHALNSEETFWEITDKLSGEVVYGFDGFVHCVTQIVLLNSGKNSKQNVANTLEQYYTNRNTNNNFVKQHWKPYIKDLQRTLQERRLTESLANLAKLLKDILDDKWYQNSINMSAVTTAMLNVNNDENLKEVIRNILHLLKQD